MKRFVAASVVALFLATPASAETGADIRGFLDTYYTISDKPADVAGGKNPNEKKFLVEGEVDIAGSLSDKVDVNLDLDVYLNGDQNGTLGKSGDSAVIEQAFFVLKESVGSFTVIGGVFNNPLGFEAEDTPDTYQFSHGQIYRILDASTALHGNNIAGLAIQGTAGAATLTVAAIDELAMSDEESSAVAALNYTFSEGIDIEIAYISQADEVNSMASANTDLGKALSSAGALKTTVGDIFNVNILFKTWTRFVFAMEYLGADEVIEHAYGVTANLGLGEKVSLTVRHDVVSYDDALFGVTLEDSKTTTGAISYAFSDNLSAVLEYKSIKDNDGAGKAAGIVAGDGSQSVLEFIAKF